MVTKQCKKCKKELELDMFYITPKGYIESRCKDCRSEYYKDYYNTHTYRHWARNTKWYHESRDIPVYMSIDELEQAAKSHLTCMICGKPLDYGRKVKGKVNDDSPTLDRLNNEGYIDNNNCIILCLKCNASKRDRTMKEFIEYCLMVVRKFRQVD